MRYLDAGCGSGAGDGELGRRRVPAGVRRGGTRRRRSTWGARRRCGETLRALLGRGQPLERVLPAFTANPARLLRLHRKGHLRPGADADLVVLDAAGAVADVMARGRWHVREGRAVVRGPFEQG